MSLKSAKVGFNLQVYFEDYVQISRDERKRAVNVANKIVEAIACKISDADERFSKSLIHVGSHYQGLKTGTTDEFDFGVELYAIGNVQWGNDVYPSITYGFEGIDNDKEENETNKRGLRIVEKRRKLSPGVSCGRISLGAASDAAARFKDMTFNGHLVPYFVKQRFRKLLADACETMRGVKLIQQLHGPALTIVIDGGDHSLAHDVCVDFAPTIRAQLPLLPSFNWPRTNTHTWLPEKLISSTESKGFNLVCKKNFFWTLSFAEMEKELSRHVDNSPGDCRKKVHRIMKVLFKNRWCHGTGLSSYYLKNAWLWYCEESHRLEWSDSFIGTRFVECAQYFRMCLLKQSLPQYFNTRNNLLEGKNKSNLNATADNIADFLTKHNFC